MTGDWREVRGPRKAEEETTEEETPEDARERDEKDGEHSMINAPEEDVDNQTSVQRLVDPKPGTKFDLNDKALRYAIKLEKKLKFQ